MTDMQEGELRWWRAHLKTPADRDRLMAIFGFRYLPFFFEEFNNLGAVADFGSGPISAARLAEKRGHTWLVDPLGDRYMQLGLAPDPILTTPKDIPAGSCDTVLCLNTLDHTLTPGALLGEIAHVLKPGGKLLLWVHLLEEPDGLHVRLTWQEVDDAVRGAGLTRLWTLVTRMGYNHDLGPPACVGAFRK